MIAPRNGAGADNRNMNSQTPRVDRGVVAGPHLARLFVGASACALALGLAACGSADESSTPVAKPVAQTTKLTVNAPIAGSTVRTQSVSVRGTVVPAGAQVQVMGKAAEVTGGLFRASTAVDMGSNTIDVVASMEGADPVTKTVVVMRGRSATQLARAVAAKEKRQAAAAARKEKAAAKADATANSSPASSGCIVVPNVVGRNHQAGQDTMQAAGLYMLAEEDATGQGRSLLFDRNWVNVAQDPAAGKCVSEDTTVMLSAKKIGE